MNGSRWWSLKRTWLVGLAVLVAAGVGLLAGVPAEGEDSITLSCTKACASTIELVGGGTYSGELTGSITAAPGKAFIAKSGARTVPIVILGDAMRGHLEGVGEVMMWLDKSRPVDGSLLRENRPGILFPATQVMKSHMMMTIESAPGRTFRSINPLVVRSANVNSFPPRGVLYRIASRVDFEDVDQPGEVAIRVLDGRVTVNPNDRIEPLRPQRFNPDEGEDAGR